MWNHYLLRASQVPRPTAHSNIACTAFTMSGQGQAGSSNQLASGSSSSNQLLASGSSWQSALAVLEQVLEEEKLPAFHWRNVLNGHNTNRAWAEGGSVNAPLGNCMRFQQGLEGMVCHLSLANSFNYADGWGLQATSPACGGNSSKEATSNAIAWVCRRALAILLLRSPWQVTLVKKAWRNENHDSIAYIREVAEMLMNQQPASGGNEQKLNQQPPAAAAAAAPAAAPAPPRAAPAAVAAASQLQAVSQPPPPPGPPPPALLAQAAAARAEASARASASVHMPASGGQGQRAGSSVPASGGQGQIAGSSSGAGPLPRPPMPQRPPPVLPASASGAAGPLPPPSGPQKPPGFLEAVGVPGVQLPPTVPVLPAAAGVLKPPIDLSSQPAPASGGNEPASGGNEPVSGKPSTSTPVSGPVPRLAAVNATPPVTELVGPPAAVAGEGAGELAALASNEPASGGNDHRRFPLLEAHTVMTGWHGTPLVGTDSVLVVPQSFHVAAGGVATDSQVSYTLASGSNDAATSGSAGHDEAASTRPASPQLDPVHTLASGSVDFEHVYGSPPTTSDYVDVQAEINAEAGADMPGGSPLSNAPWPWPMDRRPE